MILVLVSSAANMHSATVSFSYSSFHFQIMFFPLQIYIPLARISVSLYFPSLCVCLSVSVSLLSSAQLLMLQSVRHFDLKHFL